MDLISSYCVSIREKCHVSFVILQQENRNAADMDRRKAGLTESSAEDLKESGNMLNDCEIAIGVYYPLKYKLKTHCGYPIIIEDTGQQGGGAFLGLRDRYRCLCLIKNRTGISDRLIPTNFFGELGLFRELPPSKNIQDYGPYLSLLGTQSVEIKDAVHKEPTQKIIFSF